MIEHLGKSGVPTTVIKRVAVTSAMPSIIAEYPQFFTATNLECPFDRTATNKGKETSCFLRKTNNGTTFYYGYLPLLRSAV